MTKTQLVPVPRPVAHLGFAQGEPPGHTQTPHTCPLAETAAPGLSRRGLAALAPAPGPGTRRSEPLPPVLRASPQTPRSLPALGASAPIFLSPLSFCLCFSLLFMPLSLSVSLSISDSLCPFISISLSGSLSLYLCLSQRVSLCLSQHLSLSSSLCSVLFFFIPSPLSLCQPPCPSPCVLMSVSLSFCLCLHLCALFCLIFSVSC